MPAKKKFVVTYVEHPTFRGKNVYPLIRKEYTHATLWLYDGNLLPAPVHLAWVNNVPIPAEMERRDVFGRIVGFCIKSAMPFDDFTIDLI
jgi:hypothetical protein